MKGKKRERFYVESLGCPRNLVDSEFFAGLMEQGGYELIDNPLNADIIIINTCGFIKDAKEESIEQILELSEYKRANQQVRLVVTGCLVKRYLPELKESMPEVDHFVDLKDFRKFAEIFSLQGEKMQRLSLESLPYAYLRISDGCNNNCSYCAIPSIRGRVKSDSQDMIVEEAKRLAEQGIRELIVTAMDITQYGIDLEDNRGLTHLLSQLSEIEGIDWIRLLYLHPAHLTDELLYLIRDNPKICKYLDIPIQHINDDILNRMNRHTKRKEIEQILANIRSILPDAALRTTIMTGFPGETEEAFLELVDFVKMNKFNRLGVFSYSAEEGTPAHKIPGRVHHQTALRRKRELMALHDSLSEELLQDFIGQTLEVIIESKSEDEAFLYEGRTRFDAPDIDGLVFIRNGRAEIGDILQVRITESLVHDLTGDIVEK